MKKKNSSRKQKFNNFDQMRRIRNQHELKMTRGKLKNINVICELTYIAK